MDLLDLFVKVVFDSEEFEKGVMVIGPLALSMIGMIVIAPFIADVVTASVGHIPSIRTSVGFSFTRPFHKRSVHLFICHTSSQHILEIVQTGIDTIGYCIRGNGCTTDGINFILSYSTCFSINKGLCKFSCKLGHKHGFCLHSQTGRFRYLK